MLSDYLAKLARGQQLSPAEIDDMTRQADKLDEIQKVWLSIPGTNIPHFKEAYIDLLRGARAMFYNGQLLTGDIQPDGDVSFGSDLSAAATSGFHIFSNAQTYNGEVFGAGDILIGNNSSGQPNLFWDASAATLSYRSGTILIYNNTTNTGAIQADGDVFFGSNIGTATTTSLSIFSNAQTYNGESVGAGDVLIGDNTNTKPNIFWDASASELQFRLGVNIMSKTGVNRAFGNVGAKVRRTTAQSIPANVATAISFTVEDFDDAGFWDAGSPTKFTIPAGYGGTYFIVFNSFWTNTTHASYRQAIIELNGAYGLACDARSASALLDDQQSISAEVDLVAGDYVEAWMAHNEAGAINCASTSNNQRPCFSIQKIR